jgi:predicted kinase
MTNAVVMLMGLPGTGKSASGAYLEQILGFARFDPIKSRRALGYKKYSKESTTDAMLKMYEDAGRAIHSGQPVLLEGNYQSRFCRQVAYCLARGHLKEILVIEYLCAEQTAKRRMKNRPGNDGLVTSSRDPRVYVKMASSREDVAGDLSENADVSLLRFDTETHTFEDVRINPTVTGLTKQVKEVLRQYSDYYKKVKF